MNGSSEQRGADAQPKPRRRCSEHTIEIAAPVDAVWEKIVDFAGWGDWNPLYRDTSGAVRVGETIGFTVHVPGLKPMKTSALVYTVKPNSLLEYGLTNMGGLLRALRFIEIREIGPGRCIVSNGEIMSGAIGKIVGRLVGEKVRLGLQGMNEALKQLVETRYCAATGID